MTRYYCIVLFSTFLLMACADHRSTTSCSAVREGRFILKGKAVDTYSVERSGDYQYEKNLRTGTEKKYQVRWTGDCEYTLLLQRIIRDAPISEKDRVLDSLSQILTTIQIKKTNRSYYIFEARKEGISFVFEDTMWLK
jgi:hypothetical protein